jgi:hypothetical protein
MGHRSASVSSFSFAIPITALPDWSRSVRALLDNVCGVGYLRQPIGNDQRHVSGRLPQRGSFRARGSKLSLT